VWITKLLKRLTWIWHARDLLSVMYEVGVVAITFPSPRHNNNPQRTGLRTPRSLLMRWLSTLSHGRPRSFEGSLNHTANRTSLPDVSSYCTIHHDRTTDSLPLLPDWPRHTTTAGILYLAALRPFNAWCMVWRGVQKSQNRASTSFLVEMNPCTQY
jgi:hypothetical protein